MEIRKLLVNNTEYEFVCVSSGTRNGFKHTVTLFENGCQVSEGVCHYINRTWECFSYQTAMAEAIKNQLNDIKSLNEYYFKENNNYTKLTQKRKQELNNILNKNPNYIKYKVLYDTVLDYDKYYEALTH